MAEEYYSAIERNEIGLFVEMWMNLEPVMQSEVRQKEKNKYSILMSLFDSGAALEGCLKKPSIFPSEFSFHSLFLSGKDGPKSFLFASQDGIYPLLTCRNKYQSHIYANSQRAAEKTASYRWKNTIREYFTVYHPAVERRDKYSRQKEQCIESP